VQHNRFVTGVVAVAAAVLMTASLAGCTASGPSPASRVATAKQTTLAVETQIASFLPASKIVSTHQTKTSKVIFPCLGESGKSYWPGSTVVNLKPGVNTDSVLSSIAAHWTNHDGWSVFQSKDSSGNPTLIIKSSADASFTVSFIQGPQLSIVALSSCFASDGLTGLASY
jgi:hypothetical protein